VEAEVDEEDEGDEEDDEGPGDPFIADTHPDDEAALPVGAEIDDRRHRELDRQRERDLQMDAEKQAKILNERYSSKKSQASGVVTLPKRLLLPTVEDPNIWGVPVKPGKEEQILWAIHRRIEERAGTANPLPIISMFCRKIHCQTFIYAEARTWADVTSCIEGIDHIYAKKKILIPIKDVPSMLRINKAKKLQPGDYVRIKRGKYKGDVAQVDDVEPNGMDASVRIVPRLDYGLNEDLNAPAFDGGLKGQMMKRKKQGPKTAARPPPRLFSEVDAKKKHSKHLQSMSSLGKRHWTYLGDTYINGYLIKDLPVQQLETDNVKPSLEDYAKFAAGGQDETDTFDVARVPANIKDNIKGGSFMPGDMVEVYEGEQKGVYGKAKSVRADIVTMYVTEGDLRGQTIDVPVKGLRKRFKIGDHVKVIGDTRYIDEVGMVVEVKDNKVTFFSDLSMQKITLFGKDLRETTDTGVAGGHGKILIHELIRLE
jgi:transcription elongation factor SPT5